MDRKLAAKQVRSGDGLFLYKVSNTNSIWLVSQQHKWFAFSYNKNTGQVNYVMTDEWMKYPLAKKAIKDAEEAKEIKKSIEYTPVPLDFLKDNPVPEKMGLNIIGFRPLAPQEKHNQFESAMESSRDKRVKRLMDRDGDLCTYCQCKLYTRQQLNLLPKATIDHFWPVSKGGSDLMKNLVLACGTCNQNKSNMRPLDFMRMIWGDDLSGCPHKILIPTEE